MKTPNEQPAFNALVPLLDEALLSLREKDRTALLLRFYDNHSMRDVGAALGVAEDAAQKRVASAVEKLARFFQRRGFKTATLAATMAALRGTAASASAATVSNVTKVALQAAPPTFAGLFALVASFAGFTRIQKTAAFLAVAGLVAIWLWNGKQKTGETASVAQSEPASPSHAFHRAKSHNTNGQFSQVDTVTEEHAADGYEAVGYLTATVFRSTGNPSHKSVIMFDVKVAGAEWRIRTETAIESQGGIGYHEASRNTNDSILALTAFSPAYKSSESPFESLRVELQNLKRDDVYFTNPPLVTEAYSNVLASFGVSLNANSERSSNHINNVAVAQAVKGPYPPADGYLAFLWFAFTLPITGPDGMLPQCWDEGNPGATVFRRAKWTQFKEKPQLVSNAAYNWVGKKLLRSGSLEDLNMIGVSQPEEMAAHYEVEAGTNINGLTLPLNFKLTRFSPKRAANGEQIVSSTIVGSVVKVSRFFTNETLEVKIPGLTFISDYRLATDGVNTRPVTYFLRSNTIPPMTMHTTNRSPGQIFIP